MFTSVEVGAGGRNFSKGSTDLNFLDGWGSLEEFNKASLEDYYVLLLIILVLEVLPLGAV